MTADGDIHLFDVESGKEIPTFKDSGIHPTNAVFSPDGSLILSDDMTADNVALAVLLDVATGKEIRRFGQAGILAMSVAFSHDGMHVLIANDGGAARIYEVATGKEFRRFVGHRGPLETAIFVDYDGSKKDSRVLTAGFDGTVRLWNTATGDELFMLAHFIDGTWAITTPDGRFDASNDGDVDGLHWVVGMDPVELSQLKDGFYEPGLMARVWKGAMPPFPTPDFTKSEVRLYPNVEVLAPEVGQHNLTVRLTNRGGGIGRVRVWVDDTQLTEDARPEGLRRTPNAPTATLRVSLAQVPAVKAGQRRVVRVEAENASGSVTIRSRGVECSYLPDQAAPLTEPPHLYAIVIGVSEYADPTGNMNLQYAAKDAFDFANALNLSATTLYTSARTHVMLLTSDATDTVRKATRANIVAAFERVRKAAKAADVLVVYGAGHGVALRSAGSQEDIYCYLTQEARTTTPWALASTAVRGTCAISSIDLAGWLNAATGIKANKKVIFLDTCAAGSAGATLVAAARELTAEEVARARAISELKDRTAFHILMGCASDRVSYEAGEYGQGLLTYALLEGIAKSERFIEVPGIFRYVESRVPELAKGIGGIQKPQVASPRGSAIQIGEMTARDRSKIRLSARKIRILAPAFQNRDKSRDTMRLTERVELRLSNASATAATTRGGKFIYVGKGHLVGAVEPSGSYTVAGDTAIVRIVLVRDEKEVADLEVTSPSDPDKCADEVIKAILNACEKMIP